MFAPNTIAKLVGPSLLKDNLFDDQRKRLVPLLALVRVVCAVAFRIKGEMYFRKIWVTHFTWNIFVLYSFLTVSAYSVSVHFILSTPEVDDRSGGKQIETSQHLTNASSNNALKVEITFWNGILYISKDDVFKWWPDVREYCPMLKTLLCHICQCYF